MCKEARIYREVHKLPGLCEILLRVNSAYKGSYEFVSDADFEHHKEALSALAVSPGLFGAASEPEAEPESQPRYAPPSQLKPPLTPEQIKAQAKRARRAAKRAQ